MYKILLAGNNNTLIDEFFLHMNEAFESMSTSNRFEDISAHIKYFSPDAFVYCIFNEARENYNKMVRLKFLLDETKIPFILIGTKEDCDEFEKMAVNITDLVLVRPMSGSNIRSKIIKFIGDRPRPVEQPEEEEEDEIDIDALLGIEPEESEPLSVDDLIGSAIINDSPVTSAPKPADKSAPKSTSNAVSKQTSKPAASSKKSSGRKQVLVVDDNPLMLKVIKEHLHDKYDVATAISGKIALRFLASRKVDLILLDYEMPDEDGPAVLKKIREMDKGKKVPVVFLTGISDRKKIQKVLVLKPQGYLLKPIDRDKLLEEIVRYIG